jgi:hypothetical protein
VEFVDAPCYPSYRRQLHVRPGLLAEYDPYKPLALCVDFNVRYMCWPVVQYDARTDTDRVISEVVMRRPATTEGMVEAFRLQFPAHQGQLEVYGDASGKAMSTRSHRSDYDVIRDCFKGYSAELSFRVPAANPPVKDRIMAVNRRLKDAGGAVRILFDADHAKDTILDIAQTGWDKAGQRELQINDPEDDRCERSHASSALGYRTYMRNPTSRQLVNAAARRARPQFGRQAGDL